MTNQVRQSRKLEHIQYCLATVQDAGSSGMDDIHLIHNCLPEMNISDVSLHTSVANLAISSPFIINAITGGVYDVLEINRNLAIAARECDIPIAVGSQTAALEDPSVLETFRVVRETCPEGIVFGNVGANTHPDDAQRAIEMIKADALQIHLNAAQELAMLEGDRSFSGYAANIEAVVRRVSVPIIAKEVGFGIAAEQAASIQQLGVAAIDVGGRGGTNFAAIEQARYAEAAQSFLKDWGISTACSLAETKRAVASTTSIIASGGIYTGVDAVRSIALGAHAIGIAGPCLRVLLEQGLDALILFIQRLQREMKTCMVLVGASTIKDLQTIPLVVTGFTAQWLTARGIDITTYSRRSIAK